MTQWIPTSECVRATSSSASRFMRASKTVSNRVSSKIDTQNSKINFQFSTSEPTSSISNNLYFADIVAAVNGSEQQYRWGHSVAMAWRFRHHLFPSRLLLVGTMPTGVQSRRCLLAAQHSIDDAPEQIWNWVIVRGSRTPIEPSVFPTIRLRYGRIFEMVSCLALHPCIHGTLN